ncbi:MAG: hypothetical protein LBJ08_12675, partial [Bifidobacteriaceae bacterium]|nr:hypothetical protein [Bifidobacteriaceae bacterium]
MAILSRQGGRTLSARKRRTCANGSGCSTANTNCGRRYHSTNRSAPTVLTGRLTPARSADQLAAGTFHSVLAAARAAS